MFSTVILGLFLLTIPASPEGIAVLTLDAKGKFADFAPLRDNFSIQVQSHLSQPAIIGDSLMSLVTLLGCLEPDAACLGQVASSLKVRWVIFGELSKNKANLSLSVGLFDADAREIVATSQGNLSSEVDRDGLGQVVAALFESDGAAPLRRQEPSTVFVEVPKERSLVERLLLPSVLLAGAGVSGLGVLVLRSDDQPDTGSQRRAILGFSAGADALLVAGLTTLAINLLRKKKESPPQALFPARGFSFGAYRGTRP